MNGGVEAGTEKEMGVKEELAQPLRIGVIV